MTPLDPAGLGYSLSQLASVMQPPPGGPPIGPTYLDPGTGSLILQALLAALLTIPFLIRGKIRSGIGWLRSKLTRHPKPPEDSSGQT